MAGKKISAVITAPNNEPYRAYFQETEDADQVPIVAVWAANTGVIAFETRRFNNGKFSRQWIRELFADHDARTTVEF